MKIFKRILELKDYLKEVEGPNKKLVVTSGGFDPLHVGHVRCILDCSNLADIVIVVVNGDGFLTRKKGKPFMNLVERMEIISGIRGVDYVVPWDDGSQTVIGALEILKPDIFAKGGDRDSSSNVPEFDMCQKIKCEVVFNVGGHKIQSSSSLVENFISH